MAISIGSTLNNTDFSPDNRQVGPYNYTVADFKVLYHCIEIVCENNLMDRNPEHGKVSAHVHRLIWTFGHA